MKFWQKIAVGLCWLMVAVGPMSTSFHDILYHMYRYDVKGVYLIQDMVRFGVISLGVSIALCFLGWCITRQNTSKAYWFNFMSVFAVYAICFAIALHFAASGSLTVKCVKGLDRACFSKPFGEAD
jgi:hypothetical protein